MKKACFLDRDGCLIEEENYLSDPQKVRLCPLVPEALTLLRKYEYRLIVTPNQSGIARGYFTEQQLSAVETRICELLTEKGIAIDGWYYCPHHKHGVLPEYAVECDCRKPAPGLLLRAAKEQNIDLAQSVMIGDKISDVEAGFRAGCRACALVRTGHGSEQDLSPFPDAIDVPDILSAVRRLLGV